MDVESIRKERYEGYIAEVPAMAAAIGRRPPYHLEYLRRHGWQGPAPAEDRGAIQEGGRLDDSSDM